MMTRLLQDFEVLDQHTKKRLAKKNHQLTHASTYGFACDSYRVLGFHHEFSARKKPKTNMEIVRNEQTLLYKRLRKSLSVEASGTRNKSVEANSSRVIRDPEKHTTNVEPTTSHARFGTKEAVGIRFWTIPNEPHTSWPHSRSPSRMSWLREVEKVPSLQELTKVNRSKALLGISLKDSGIHHWCPQSVYCEVNTLNASCKSAVQDEMLNTQKPQENLDNISNGSSLPHNNRDEKEVCAEPAPLSYDELLKEKDVKVLAPRLCKTFLSEQKSRATYPAANSPQHHQFEPITSSSAGFPPVDPPPQIRKRRLFSAILLYKADMQTMYMIRRIRERQTGEGCGGRRPYSQPELKSGIKCVSVRVLTADGKLIKSPDLNQLPLYYYDEKPAACAVTPTKKMLLIPKRTILSSCYLLGPVINGTNPRQTCESGKITPACCKPPHPSPRGELSLHSLTPQHLAKRLKKSTGFPVNLSKAPQHNALPWQPKLLNIPTTDFLSW